MHRIAAALAFASTLSALSCASPELQVPVSPPPPPAVAAAPTPPPPAAPSSSAAPTPPLAPPVIAKLVDVGSAGAKIPIGSRCDVLYVAAAKGSLLAAGQALSAGDVLMASGFAAAGTLDVKGAGLAVVVTALHECPASSTPPTAPMALRVARAGDAADLSFAKGAMHARLDLEKDASPEVYVGRLEGTAPVAEHDHPTSWEVLCAIEGAGTFTLDGAPKHIAAPVVVAVPPGHKHSWQPDAGVRLVAVQVYAPPGPEQRFKALSQP